MGKTKDLYLLKCINGRWDATFGNTLWHLVTRNEQGFTESRPKGLLLYCHCWGQTIPAYYDDEKSGCYIIDVTLNESIIFVLLYGTKDLNHWFFLLTNINGTVSDQWLESLNPGSQSHKDSKFCKLLIKECHWNHLVNSEKQQGGTGESIGEKRNTFISNKHVYHQH